MTPEHLVAITRMSNFEPAWAAVLHLLRRPPGAGVTSDLLAQLAQPALQARAHAFALGHAVLGAMLVSVEQAVLPTGKAGTYARLLAPLGPMRKRAVLWELELGRVVGALQRGGLNPVVLKGAALRATVYVNSAERDLGDLDLLVDEAEIPRAVDLLRAIGYEHVSEETTRLYEEHHFHYRLVHRSGFQTEVHWDLLPPGSPYRLDPTRVIAASEVIEFPGGLTARVPAPEDMLLHLASQQLEDAVTTLRRVVDIDRLLRTSDLDWDEIGRRARSSGLGPVLGVTLVLARRLLGSPFPPGIPDRLGISRITRFHLSIADPVSSVLGQIPRRRAALARFWEIWLLPSIGSRLRLVVGMLTGRFDAFSHLDPGGAGPPNVFLRVIALIKLSGYWGWLYLIRLAAAVTGRQSSGRGFWRDDLQGPVLQESDEAATLPGR